MRDEGEAYANKLREARVPITAVRFQVTIIEQGEAVRAEGYWWTYTTNSQVPQNPAPRIAAIAKDLPGNSEGLVWQDN